MSDSRLQAAGPITAGDCNKLLPFTSDMVMVELRGELLLAIVQRNRTLVGTANFLYVAGVDYSLEPAAAIDLRAVTFATSHPNFGGVPVQADGWYKVCISDYELDTSLSGLSARADGCRNRQSKAGKYAAGYMMAYFESGGTLGKR